MTAKEKFTLFYGGVFSQWFPSIFEIDGVQYTCAEQAMMAFKATLFSDESAYREIMRTNSPREMKAWGRKVKNFNAEAWAIAAEPLVKVISRAKFGQNPQLLKQLLLTEGTTLVEASPTDKIWGIGRSESDPLCHSRKHWRGTNLLGKVLTEVRDEFLAKGAFVIEHGE